MFRVFLSFLLLSVLSALSCSIVFADYGDDTISAFNQQGDSLNLPKPEAESEYYATKAPLSTKLRGYLGLNGELSFTTLNTKIYTTGGTAPAYEYVPQKTPFTSYNINIFGGYGLNYDWLYLGAELSAGYNALSDHVESSLLGNYAKIKFKRPWNFSLDIMPGIITMHRDLLLYARFGGAGSLFSSKLSNVTSSTTNDFLFGWRAGAGMEYFLGEMFSIRFEYIYNEFSNIDVKYTSTASAVGYNYKVKAPRFQQVNLGLVINF